MIKRRVAPYNLYFFVPFFMWVLAGGYALLTFSKQDLFFSINGRYSGVADIFFYYITGLGQAEIIMPVLVGLLFIPRFRNWWFFFTALACNIVPFFIQHYIKDLLNLPRPQLLFENFPGLHYLPEWPRLLHSSFPSGHSQGAFSFFCFLSLLLPPPYRKFGALFCLMALLVAYSRIYLAAHFFADVYAGSIIGAAATLIVFIIMDHYRQRFSEKKNTFD